MNKPKKEYTMIQLLASLIIGSVLGIVAAPIFYNPFNEAPVYQAPLASDLIQKYGETFKIDDIEPIPVTIINDSDCESCATDEILQSLRSQLGLIAISELDYTDPQVKKVTEKYSAEYLPFVLLGSEVEQKPNFAHLTHHTITKNQDRYQLDFDKSGAQAGRYLDVESYNPGDPEAPKIFLSENSKQLGDVSLANGKISTDIEISNTGQSPLTITGLNTSCGCTSAQVITATEESPVYMMAGHGAPVKWRGEIAPGDSDTLRIFYDPSVHPDLEGEVMREVYVMTNDPETPMETIKIFVNQTK